MTSGPRLSHEEQRELFETLVAVALNLIFLALVALLLWPLGRTMLALRLAKGYGVLWLVTSISSVVVNRIQRLFRVDLYNHVNAYVISNLAVSCLLQAGWSAFAALTVRGAVVHSSIWIAVAFYLAAILSCLVAFYVIGSFYQGHLYKLINLPLALVSFIVFSVWPASGRLMYGWFFELL